MNCDPSPDMMLKDYLEAQGGVWHSIDFEDVSISAPALEALKKAAREILPRFVPLQDLKNLTVADSLCLLTRYIFWDEESHRLSLCTELGDRRYCLYLPESHWGIKNAETHC